MKLLRRPVLSAPILSLLHELHKAMAESHVREDPEALELARTLSRACVDFLTRVHGSEREPWLETGLDLTMRRLLDEGANALSEITSDLAKMRGKLMRKTKGMRVYLKLLEQKRDENKNALSLLDLNANE